MSISELTQRTTTNIQEKANLIWAIADKLVGTYKPHEYGGVILPYAPEAWIDEKKTKVGYEIPFAREFYKYVAPRSSEEIFASLLGLEEQEQELLKSIMQR